MKFKKQTNCVYRCEYHVVITTKYRRKIFNAGVFAYTENILKKLPEFYPEIEVLSLNHDEDHIHMLLSIPPKLAVGRVVGIIKANTARHLRKKFDYIKKAYWGNEGVWSDGYFVSTVGINESQIKKYILLQGKEDLGQAQLEIA